jgi:hypothetical protein
MTRDDRPDLDAIAPAASAEEAAAIVAALERYIGDRRSAQAAHAPQAVDPWRRAALLEGVSRAIATEALEPWINV